MITVDEIKEATLTAEPLFLRLDELYDRLPKTECTCEQSGVCCTFLPEMTVLEALQWIKFMQTMSDSELSAKLRQFVEFYMTNPARLSGCPFKEDGVCTNYRYRTFGCRSYGLWSQEMGRMRTRESRNGKKALRQMWKRYSVEIPADVVEFEIDYCDKVQIQSGKTINDTMIMELLESVYDLGKSLGDLQTRFEEEYHSDFSYFLASLFLGMRKALLLKFAVIKEIVQKGTNMRLQETLEKVSPDIIRSP